MSYDFGDSISSRGMVRTGERHLTSALTNHGTYLLAIRSHHYAVCDSGGDHALPDSDDERFPAKES
jgi:hypothetical protein